MDLDILFFFFCRLLALYQSMLNMKGNPLMEKKGSQKNPRACQEILLQVAVGLGRVERWLQVLEMMVLLKGVLT